MDIVAQFGGNMYIYQNFLTLFAFQVEITLLKSKILVILIE